MKVKDLSLRSKMVVGGISLVIIPLIIIGMVTFINSSRTLEDISKMQAVQIARSLSSMTQIAIQKELNILSAMAKDPLIVAGTSSENFESLQEKLGDLYDKVGTDYEGLAVVDTKGIVRVEAVDKTRVGISVAEREYIKLARQGKAGIGRITASKATGKPILGLSAPIMSPNGRYIGCVLGVLKIDFLVKYILSLSVGQTGYAIMLDQKGIVIAHPNPDYILKLDSLKDNELSAIVKRMINGETGTGEYTFRGKQKIMGFTPIELTGWSVGVIQEKGEVMALAYTNRNLILMVSGFFLLLTIWAVFFLSRTISTPVQKTLTTLNQAIEQATEAIFIIGLDKKVQFANPAMADIIDRPVQDIINQIPDLQNTDIINPGEIWQILEGGDIWTGRVNGVTKNSTSFTMNLTITPVRDQAGRINCFLAIGKDITRELMMEAQLRQSQKMEAIGTLASGISHDFNNILGAIFGYSELTLLHLTDKKKSEQDVKKILHAAKRARDLVNHIMTFSRQVEQQKQPIKPRHIIKEALMLLHASLPTTIEIRPAIKSYASIMADPTQINQIVMNLCTNAGYAMREQGGILSIQLEDVELDQAFAQHHQEINPGTHVVLKISDTGAGIPPAIMDRLFDPFFTTKPHGEGTGLGLSVVHGIVKSMAGMIMVASQVGQGTTFTIYIPVNHGETPDFEKNISDDIFRGTERILLIDDEEMLIQTGKEMIDDLGYNVTGYTNSIQALEAFLTNPMAFDAVITDYTMPHMTGYDLAKNIREIRPDIPIIMCSGYMDEEMELKIKNAGITAFVKKPFMGNDMAALLRRAFGTASKS